MPPITSPEFRFRQFRESAGLSHDDAAQQMGISSASLWDIESCDDEISELYSLNQVRQFCRVLGIRASQLFGVETKESPVTAAELVRLIHEQCRVRGVTLLQFEDIVGWRLNGYIEPPERLFEDITIEALKWLCEELEIEWHQVILSL